MIENRKWGTLKNEKQKILQKAAKKSLSWLLILGMLVTLPETPGAISAAAAELETGTEETVHEESGDADRVDETKML